jgi:hypothetical protein
VRTLVIHAGLPKTGTTTLQRDVFPRLPGYLGGNSSPENSELFHSLRALHAERPGKWETAAWRSRAIQWWEASARADHSVPLIVSSESLYTWGLSGAQYVFEPKRRPTGQFRPLATFIERLSDALLGRAGLRVILTVRNQPEFLASLYAQGSNKFPEPSQADFEARVRALVSARDDSLDWAGCVDALHGTIGPENVLVPVFEDGLETIVRQVGSFVGSGPSAPVPMGRHNARGAGAESWAVRHRTSAHRVLRMPSVLWPVDVAPKQRRYVKRAIGLDRLETRLQRAAQVGERRRSAGTITVTPELRSEVLEAWAESNARLAELLERDLRPHGY